MIIGNGLIASEFKKIPFYLNNDDVIIFAAGVSNSNCSNLSDFRREYDLVINTINKFKNSFVVYFSSCALNNNYHLLTPYLNHKFIIESIISSHPKYLIIRTPQLIGKTSNNNTFINNLFNKMINNELIELWSDAERNFLDVFDLADITNILISSKIINNMTIDIANLYNSKPIEIFKEFESLLGITSDYKLIKKGDSISINLDIILKLFPDLLNRFHSPLYLRQALQKYYF